MPILVFKNGKITSRTGSGGSYDGEKQMGDLNNMLLFDSDSNKILEGSYGLLSERSTTLYHTYGPVKAAINKQTEYGIGPGLVFRSQPNWNILGWTPERAKDWGKEFQRIIHAYQTKLNFYEKQSILFRSALYSGDSLLFFERDDKGLLTDLIETLNNQIAWNFNDKDFTLGIKHDDWLRRVGIKKADGTEVNFRNSAGDQNVIQFYIKELGRQLRGYPLAYSIINLARNDDTHTDAITHRAVMEAVMMAVFKGNGTDLNQQAKNIAKKNRLLKSGATSENPSVMTRLANMIKFGAGNILTLNSQEDYEFTELKTPSNTFGDYKSWMLNYTAMATGTPPEVILSKYESSFTAHKGALNDFVKSFMKKRTTFERTVMNSVIREIAKDAITQGFISAPGFFSGGWMIQQAYLEGMYLGPVPGHINPFVEVKANKLAVDEAFKLRSDVAAESGNEWDNFIPEWEEEQRKFKEIPQDAVGQAVFNQETEGNNA